MRQGLLIGGAVVGILIGVVAYSTRDEAESHVPVLRIGSVLGDHSALERGVRQGLLLAQSDLNSEWANETQVELVFRDSGGSAQTAEEQLRALREEGVSLVADVVGETVIEGCVAQIREPGLVVVSAANTGPLLQRRLGASFFQVAPPQSPEVSDLARFVREMGLRGQVVFHSLESRAQAKAYQVAGTLPQRGLLEIQSADQISWALDQLSELQPQAVVLFLEPALAGALVQQAVQRGLPATYLGDERLASEAFAKAAGQAALEHVRFVLPGEASGSSSEPQERVAAAWQQRFGEGEPHPVVFQAYDALQVLARAGRGAADVGQTLRNMRATQYAGSTGQVAFHDGERELAPHRRMTYTSDGVQVPWTRRRGGK